LAIFPKSSNFAANFEKSLRRGHWARPREAELFSNRMDVLLQSFKARRTIETVLISNQNAVRNIHYNGLINKNITLDDLMNM